MKVSGCCLWRRSPDPSLGIIHSLRMNRLIGGGEGRRRSLVWIGVCRDARRRFSGSSSRGTWGRVTVWEDEPEIRERGLGRKKRIPTHHRTPERARGYRGRWRMPSLLPRRRSRRPTPWVRPNGRNETETAPPVASTQVVGTVLIWEDVLRQVVPGASTHLGILVGDTRSTILYGLLVAKDRWPWIGRPHRRAAGKGQARPGGGDGWPAPRPPYRQNTRTPGYIMRGKRPVLPSSRPPSALPVSAAPSAGTREVIAIGNRSAGTAPPGASTSPPARLH